MMKRRTSSERNAEDGAPRSAAAEYAALLTAPHEPGDGMTTTSNPLAAIRFAIEFNAPHAVSLRGLCNDDHRYSTPTKSRPYAAKTLADGSEIRISPWNEDCKSVIAAWNGNAEDWGAVRFAIDTLYRDLSRIGIVAALPAMNEPTNGR